MLYDEKIRKEKIILFKEVTNPTKRGSSENMRSSRKRKEYLLLFPHPIECLSSPHSYVFEGFVSRFFAEVSSNAERRIV